MIKPRQEAFGPQALSALISRRDLLKGMGAIGAGVGLAAFIEACGGTSTGGTASTEVIYSSWGGSWADWMTTNWFKPFTAQTGIKVIVTGPPDYGKIESMVKAGQTQWDIAEVVGDFIFTGQKSGWLEPINFSVVNKSNYAGENSLIYNDVSVPQALFSQVVAWNTNKLPTDHPNTWADIWDLKRFPGKRAMDASSLEDGVLEAALTADGVAPSQMYPLDVNRALKKLDQIKSSIIWYHTGAEGVQLFQTGQVSCGLGWDGRLFNLKATGGPVDFTHNQAIEDWSSFVVPKGAPHPDAAMKLLAYVVQAKQQGLMATGFSFGPINPAAFQYVPTAMQSKLAGGPDEVQSNAVTVNLQYWSENYDSITQTFTSWLNA